MSRNAILGLVLLVGLAHAATISVQPGPRTPSHLLPDDCEEAWTGRCVLRLLTVLALLTTAVIICWKPRGPPPVPIASKKFL